MHVLHDYFSVCLYFTIMLDGCQPLFMIILGLFYGVNFNELTKCH